jgi:hypothetical protein
MRALAFIAGLLWAIPAIAGTPPSVGSTSNTSGTPFIASATVSVSTAHHPSLVVISTYGTINSALAGNVLSVVDSGSAGLTFTKRGASASNNTTCIGGSATHCTVDVEEWTAVASTNLTSETVTVTYANTMLWIALNATEVYNLFSNSAPWDTNSSLPVTKSGVTSVPNFSGFTTTEADDLIVAYNIVGRNTFNGFAPCFLTFGMWANTMGNFSQGNAQSGTGALQAVSSTQNVTANEALSGASCPSGLSTNSGDNWAVMLDAFTGDAAPAKGGGFIQGFP